MEDLDPRKGSGSLIAIGCGAGSDLIAAMLDEADTPECLILFDPEKKASQALPTAIQRHSDITHIKAIPDVESGDREAISYSLPGLVSLAEPTPLLSDLFPGLKERKRQPVALIGADDLAKRLTDLPTPLHCCIDLPGSEAGILDALKACSVLERLSSLTLRCGVDPFFEGALSSSDLRRTLTDLGFTLRASNTDDPDWPELHFTADPQARVIKALEQEAENLRTESGGLRATLEKLKDAYDAQSAEMRAQDARIVSLLAEMDNRDKSLGEAQAALEAQQAEITKRDAQIAGLQEELDNKVKALTGAQATLEAQQAEITKRDAQIASVQEELDSKVKALTDAQAALEAQQAEIAKRDAQIADQEAQLTALKRDVAQVTAAKNDAEKLLMARDESLEKAKQSNAEQAALLAEHRDALDQSAAEAAQKQSEIDALSQKLKEAEQKLFQVTGARDAAQAKLAEVTAALDQSRTALRSKDAELAERSAEIDAMKADLAAKSEAVALAEQRHEQSASEHAFQTRVNAMIQLDLDNLRKRYEDSERNRRKQEELLRKLTPKLAQAAEHLQHLQLAATESEPPAATTKTATRRRKTASKTTRARQEDSE